MCTTAQCSELGEQAKVHALTRAADGTVWLAYISAVVDRGVTLRVAHFFVDYCTTDRYFPKPGDGVLKLVLGRVVPGMPSRIDERYRATFVLPDAAFQPTAFTDFSIRGNRLHLSLMTGKHQLRRMIFDAQRL